tara:strand:+ start:43 stop:468 length:426 start_codon:yes stop_codon:yes gene_type:complete
MSKSSENAFVIALLCILLCACNMTGEKVVDRGPLKVYFSNSTNEKIIVKFADFWIQENYIQDRPQNIKITEDTTNKVYQIRLILRKNFSSKMKIDFEELKLIGQIQQDLNTHVFQEKKCELVICDNKFQTISTPIPINSEQ